LHDEPALLLLKKESDLESYGAEDLKDEGWDPKPSPECDRAFDLV
jgi:hypothetical protein